ncbi:HAD family hydrolase [Pseudoxanthomonas sp. PXM02]|uniref:HAD-IA family hydrolase n=1 Tax=Pseudoxanthomonas sp. PXM02 TaxID=2769294 RepID=UPI001783B4F4|nr:HAD family hydrolase [Pseudoxanthomonas sp. PXM02]
MPVEVGGATTPALAALRHWVFDLDGTLTEAVHDFALIRRALDIPPAADILGHLAVLPADEAQRKRDWLMQHERALAEAATAATGAVALVRALQGRGCRLGILTRNARALARVTLEAIGLGDVFDEADIIGRDETVPKPAPDGLLYFADRWAVPPAQMVMVGDYLFDLECGRAAGTHTLLVNCAGEGWPALATWRTPDCAAILAGLDAG